jgi:hypothetical protein
VLWYKGWLETRRQLLLLVGSYIALLLFAAMHQPGFHGFPPPSQALAILRSTAMNYFVATISILLAGTGVRAQKSIFRPAENTQGAALFTRSLPVTRLRLLAVRAGLGWLEVAGGIALVCAGLWGAFEAIRGAVPPLEMFKYAAALIACATGVYSLGVVLSTLVRDRAGVWAAVILLILLLEHLGVPISVDPLWELGAGSRVAYGMPWPVIGVSAACSGVLFTAAWKILCRQD